MTTRALDSNHDYTLSTTHKRDELVQNLTTKLRFWKGEWFLNTLEGTPYKEMLGYRLPINNVESKIRARILETPGVTEIKEFHIEIINRKADIKFSVVYNGELYENIQPKGIRI